MRVIVVHNFYQQPGGEDQVFKDECELLKSNGHRVVQFTKHNDDIVNQSRWKLSAGTVWSRTSAATLARLVQEHSADIVHFHNTFPLISPSAYCAARQSGAAVVQTLHNYRLICPKATFLRGGALCESCLGHAIPWHAVQYGCYRDSCAATAVVAAMLTVHRAIGTYRNSIDAYIALSQFARGKHIAAGLPARKIHVRPNFMMHDPGLGPGNGGFVLFVGRLAPEKGIEQLLKAWRMDSSLPPLRIIGNGPLAPLVERSESENARIQWLGSRSWSDTLEVIGSAIALIVPSVWYEGFPKVIVEAYSKGTPVLASRLGSMAEIIHEGVSGDCFIPGDVADLTAVVNRLATDPQRQRGMRAGARQTFESHYLPATSYDRLLDIYVAAMESRGRTRAILSDGVRCGEAAFHKPPARPNMLERKPACVP